MTHGDTRDAPETVSGAVETHRNPWVNNPMLPNDRDGHKSPSTTVRDRIETELPDDELLWRRDASEETITLFCAGESIRTEWLTAPESVVVDVREAQ